MRLEGTLLCFTNDDKRENISESLYIGLSELLKESIGERRKLPTPHDVPADQFIKRLTSYLKDNVDQIIPPSWASIVKTGAHTQKPPENPDWWYIRCASLLRKIYIHGPIGIGKLRVDYGGRKDYGVKPEHAVKAGGAIIRKALQQLEAAGLVEKYQNRGRMVTKKGKDLLNEIAEEVMRELIKVKPDMEKYLIKGD